MESNNESLKIQNLLQQVRILIEKQNEIQKATGENFNIFSVLKMERNEVETHSALIYELINPSGLHSQRKLFLEGFVKDVLREKEFNVDFAKVEREKFLGDKGRVDFWIENNEKILIVEMKIDAGDQVDQLKKYEKYAKEKNKDHEIFYLTLFGDEASEESAGEGENKINYKTKSFQIDILDWIEDSVKLASLKPILRETLRQYAILIRKITGLSSQESEMEVIKMLLNGNNLEVADKIAKSLPRAKAKVEYDFWEALYKKIETDKEMPFSYDWFIFERSDFKNKDDDIVDEIIKERKKVNGEIGIHYYVGSVKKDTCKLYLDVGANTAGKINISLFLWDVEKEKLHRTNNKYIDLKDSLEKLGFPKSSNLRHMELSYSYDDIFEYYCKGKLMELVENVKNEVVKISQKVNSSEKLREIVKME